MGMVLACQIPGGGHMMEHEPLLPISKGGFDEPQLGVGVDQFRGEGG